MSQKPLSSFVSYCKAVQPQSYKEIRRFFEGVVCFPYDNELLLQAYLFLTIETVFPVCHELLLFEKPPYGGYTNKGKCDFVYLTADHQLLLVETKYIDLASSGGTKRKRRNKHRNKVFEQVLGLKKIFCEHWEMPEECIKCAVFTTDPHLSERGGGLEVEAQFISMTELFAWQEQFKASLEL